MSSSPAEKPCRTRLSLSSTTTLLSSRDVHAPVLGLRASKLPQDPFDSMINTCSRGLMSNSENQDRGRNVRDRIATIVQAHEQARRKQTTNEKIQILRRAVGR